MQTGQVREAVERDRERALQAHVDRRMRELVLQAEAKLRSIDALLSGDDSGLADPFEEYAAKLAEEHSLHQ